MSHSTDLIPETFEPIRPLDEAADLRTVVAKVNELAEHIDALRLHAIGSVITTEGEA